MQLEADFVAPELGSGKPRPADRGLALFDPLLRCAPLIVERDDPFGGPRHIGNDEADARIKLTRMPFHFCHHAPCNRP